MDKSIKLFWFKEVPNFGDLLSPFIIEAITGNAVNWAQPKETNKLLGLGSIIDFANEGDVIWGSGVKKPFSFNVETVEVLAVRGPRTAKILGISENIQFGDPGILVPNLIPITSQRHGKIVIVPHYVDYAEIVAKYGNDPAFLIVDVTDTDFYKNCQLIAASDFVISSSLHGIIIAESYGIPAHWMKVSEKIIGGSFKFNDYYESSNRNGKLHFFENGINKIVKSDTQPLPKIDTTGLISCLTNYFGSPI